MNKTAVVISLAAIREARAKWVAAHAGFNTDVDKIMKRLLNEAAVNMMNADEVARLSGLTVKRVRIMMRANNLNPRNGKRLLARTASETLAANAELMGIEPREMDLMSPLAYLPMGSHLREFLRNDVDPDEVLYEDSVICSACKHSADAAVSL